MTAELAGVLWLALGLGLLSASAVLLASCLRPASAAELALGAYVVAFAEVVGLVLLLSTFGELGRGTLLGGLAFLLAGSAGVWLAAGAPRPPLRVAAPASSLVRPVLVLGTAVAAAYGYVALLIVGTPPNGWDQLVYHLTRAALWLQDGRVGYIAHAYDERLNFNPPNAEIAFAFVLALAQHENAAAAVQLVAALACALGIYTLARQLGLGAREGVFGAFLFLTLPIVVLQSSTTKNDLVVASLLTATAAFVIGSRRSHLGLAALAAALATGTKFTAPYGLAVALVLALAVGSQRPRAERVGALAVGALGGSYWYVVNLLETGTPLGDQSGTPGLTAVLDLRANLVTAYGFVVDLFDVPGASGRAVALFPLLAACGILILATGRGRNRRATALALAAAGLVPFLILSVCLHLLLPGLPRLRAALGAPRAVLGHDPASPFWPTFASDTASWYGPAGLFLIVAAAAGCASAVRRRQLPPAALVLGLAPAATLALAAATLTYHPWHGRFYIFSIACSAAVWGLALRSPVTAWPTVLLASGAMVLALVNYQEKPSGLPVLGMPGSASVWGRSRASVQSQYLPEIEPLLAFVDERVPADASLALALGNNDFAFPFVGPTLERTLTLLPFGSNGRDTRTGWLVADEQRSAEIDRTCWQPRLVTRAGTVFARRESCR